MRAIPVLLLLVAVLTGCDTGRDSPKGFSLPEGDAEAGKKVFLYTGCLSCHVIDGIESDIAIELDEPIKLGGKTTQIKTYAELVTSVINPSHKIPRKFRDQGTTEDGASKMRNYNDTLTVQQLIDLVTFLETRYELAVYQPTPYVPYYP